MANYHVSRNKETKKWDIQKEGAKRTSGSADTQREAEHTARNLLVIQAGVRLESIALKDRYVIVIPFPLGMILTHLKIRNTNRRTRTIKENGCEHNEDFKH